MLGDRSSHLTTDKKANLLLGSNHFKAARKNAIYISIIVSRYQAGRQ